MNRILKIELERAFKNKTFVIVVGIMLTIVVFHTCYYVIPARNSMDDLISLYNSNPKKTGALPGAIRYWFPLFMNVTKEIVFPVIPLLAAASYGTSMYLDCKRHYINMLVIKVGKKQYYLSKIITLFLVGGVVAIIPLLGSLLANFAILPTENVLKVSGQYMVNDKNFFGDLFYQKPFIYIVIYICWTFLFYGMLNIFCFISAFFLDNKFVVAMSPFILFLTSYVVVNVTKLGVPMPWEYFKLNGSCYLDDWWKVVLQLLIYLILIIGVFEKKCSAKSDIL